MWPKPNVERKPWELPYYGAVQDDRYFHRGGSSYMPFEREKVAILKDYGQMTHGEWVECDGELTVYSDFPPIESKPAEYDLTVGAWISPTGALYLCCSGGHEILAKRLVIALGIKGTDSSLNIPGDLLVERKWAKVYLDMVLTTDPTRKQADTLFDILVTLENKEESPGLCNSIRSDLDMQPRAKTVHNAVAVEPKDCTTPGILRDTSERPSIVEDEPRPFKPFVLTNQPFVEFTVRAYYTIEDMPNGLSRGISCFKTFCTDVYSDDDDPAPLGEHGEYIGTIGGGTGYVTLRDDRRADGQGGGEFFIRHRDVWYAYQKALDEKFGALNVTSSTKERRTCTRTRTNGG